MRVAKLPLGILLFAVSLSAADPSIDRTGLKSGFFTTSDGVKLHYLESGAGPAILFVPGWTGVAEFWAPQMRHFAGSHRVVALDPRSQGDSDKPAEGIIRVRSFGIAVESFSITTQQKLISLSEEYVYAVDEIKKRFEFRPGEAMTAVAVQVYRLPNTFEIPVKTKYGGCVSWVNLEDSISTEHATPALTDTVFNQRLTRIRDLLR